MVRARQAAKEAMVLRLVLRVISVERKGIGQEIALVLRTMLRLNLEDGLHRQAAAISVERRGTGPGTALLVNMQSAGEADYILLTSMLLC